MSAETPSKIAIARDHLLRARDILLEESKTGWSGYEDIAALLKQPIALIEFRQRDLQPAAEPEEPKTKRKPKN